MTTPLFKGSKFFLMSTSTWETFQTISTTSAQRRRRHGLAIGLRQDDMPRSTWTLELAAHYNNHRSNTNQPVSVQYTSLHIAVAAAAAILQHGEAVHLIVDDPDHCVEVHSFIDELLQTAGILFATANQGVLLEWEKIKGEQHETPTPSPATTSTSTSTSTTSSSSSTPTTTTINSCSTTCWSQAMFPFGPSVHDVLRTTNGIHFSNATKEKVTIALQHLPDLEIMQSTADGFEGLGAVVWQCGEVLCHFFDTNANGKQMIQNKTIYDLGCGTGLVGIVAAMCGAKSVVLSDRQDIVHLAKTNVLHVQHHVQENRFPPPRDGASEEQKETENHHHQRTNKCIEDMHKIIFEVYQWQENTATCTAAAHGPPKDGVGVEHNDQQNSAKDKYDVVIVSDGLYDHHSFNGLFDTIQALFIENDATVFLFGYKMRHPLREHAFFNRLVDELELTLQVYTQSSSIHPRQLRGTGIFIVRAAKNTS